MAARVEVVREFSTYTWWLKEQVAARSDADGNCEPRFDFVYLDGAKNWTVDGLAVVLVEKLLRPGGWLLMDDLDWTYAQDPGREATDGIVHRELSEPERTQPHLRAVFELIVAQHPSFTDVRVQDEWWGWARKAPGEPRRYTVETSRPLGALAAGTRARRSAGVTPGAVRDASAPGTTQDPGYGRSAKTMTEKQGVGWRCCWWRGAGAGRLRRPTTAGAAERGRRARRARRRARRRRRRWRSPRTRRAP